MVVRLSRSGRGFDSACGEDAVEAVLRGGARLATGFAMAARTVFLGVVMACSPRTNGMFHSTYAGNKKHAIYFHETGLRPSMCRLPQGNKNLQAMRLVLSIIEKRLKLYGLPGSLDDARAKGSGPYRAAGHSTGRAPDPAQARPYRTLASLVGRLVDFRRGMWFTPRHTGVVHRRCSLAGGLGYQFTLDLVAVPAAVFALHDVSRLVRSATRSWAAFGDVEPTRCRAGVCRDRERCTPASGRVIRSSRHSVV